jgi:hypothetical protein
MKQSLSLILIAAAALVAGTTFAQAPQGQSSDIAALRRDVARLEAKVAALEALAVEEQVDELDGIFEYLEAQAAAAKTLQAKMAEADTEGFTWGVNPKAHELVLTGIEGLAASMQQGLPKRKAKADDQQPSR